MRRGIINHKPAASIFRVEDGGSRFLLNVGPYLPDDSAVSHKIIL
jgi:hypothetical protein